MIDNGAADLKKEIPEFIKDEILLYGTERGTRAAVIINDFSTISSMPITSPYGLRNWRP